MDDPYDFGTIAAANALSDVYAMGGRPLTVMNIVCFPIKELEKSILKEILRGGLDKIHEAGAVLVGGHSVDDPEIKYGLSVTGLVHPNKVLTNAGARIGDAIILTKPLGTGVLATVIKAKLATEEIERKMARIMSELNRRPAEIMDSFTVNACTDVTGFGLLGHALEVAHASHMLLEIDSREVPLIPEAVEFASMGFVPEGTHANKNFCSKSLQVGESVDPITLDILADAQTSGGLLIFSPRGEELLRALNDGGVSAARLIGRVTSEHKKGVLKIR